MKSAPIPRRPVPVILVGSIVALTVAAGDAVAQQAPYPPAAKLEEALGGLGSRAGARWYDPGTRVISSTDPFLSVNATTAFHLSPFPGVCPSGVGPGSPCTSWPATVGTDVFGQAVVEILGGTVKCRCPSP